MIGVLTVIQRLRVRFILHQMALSSSILNSYVVFTLVLGALYSVLCFLFSGRQIRFMMNFAASFQHFSIFELDAPSRSLVKKLA